MAVAVEPIRPDNLLTNPYEVIPATIYDVIEESPLIRTLRLRPEKPIKSLSKENLPMISPDSSFCIVSRVYFSICSINFFICYSQLFYGPCYCSYIYTGPVSHILMKELQHQSPVKQ